MEENRYRLGYRPDIEGLRAVAVSLVILSHAGVSAFGGGFIGVDVFFVLSGYLISGLLISEFANSDKIDFLRFYTRRLQRLAPALLVMLVVTSIMVYRTIAPLDQGPHYAAGATAALWMSNLHFSMNELDYFSAGTSENMFLHTWSLSVEEQFYLLWPALIILTLKTRGQKSSPTPIKALLWALLLVTAASFSISWYLTYNHSTWAYYLPTSRAWQFAAGALALLVTFKVRKGVGGISPSSHPTKPGLTNVLGWLGLGLVLLSAILITDTSHYPGTWAIAPTLGTALMLIAGTNPGKRSVSNALSARPLVFIGNLSYGWYLWHWPVLLLAKILNPTLSPSGAAVAIGVSLVLAWLSYRLLESPIRHSQYLSARPRLFCSIAIALMVAVVTFQLYLLRSSQVHILSPEMEKIGLIRNNLPIIYAQKCDEWIESADLKKCEFGTATPEHQALLIGDSIAGQWFSAGAEIGQWPDWRFTVLTKSACPLVDIPFFYKAIGKRYEVCEVWRAKLVAEIQRSKPDLVIMGSSHNYPYTSAQWEDGTSSLLAQVADSAGSIIIVRSTPILPVDPIRCVANRLWQQKQLPFDLPIDCSVTTGHVKGDAVYSALQAAAMRYSNVRTVDLNALVCPNDICAATSGDTFVFRDNQHLTDHFVKLIKPELLRALQIGSHKSVKD
jgi:peptidoglycan/LPS O-acetylase OafA/YrhL